MRERERQEEGPAGPQGEPGPGGSETGASILQKLAPVDGAGSFLNSDYLDGYSSSSFLPATGKAADANLLDGINSSGFARLSASGSGLISISGGIAADSCTDGNIPMGNVDPGDVVIVREGVEQRRVLELPDPLVRVHPVTRGS